MKWSNHTQISRQKCVPVLKEFKARPSRHKMQLWTDGP
ncbi:hypothetical protein E2C01_014612 [Portunus trituberculatus]|uniref:Uncharacterized protein n=1 Tax=Portunus trituberculatus TaxID=210409 RepID=A0A5B7DJC1_PORTR|nr:hypothetical protein [Portunus trituberculatus]